MIASTKGAWAKNVVSWRDGDCVMISVVFTWQVPEAVALSLFCLDLGLSVRVGGPGVFTRRLQSLFPAEVQIGGEIKDVVARHNPMATFASRGCDVGCWFCIVPKMEGRAFTLLPDFEPRPVLCDNNLSALPADYQQHIVDRYLAAEVPLLDANSGFEPKTFDEEVLRRWSPVLKGPWRFGFDEASEGAEVERVMRMLRHVSPRRKQVYTMIGHEPFDVCMDRIQRILAWGGEPYVQPFIKLNALEKKPAIRHDWTEQRLGQVKRWVNRHLWRKTPNFSDYRAGEKTNPRALARSA